MFQAHLHDSTGVMSAHSVLQVITNDSQALRDKLGLFSDVLCNQLRIEFLRGHYLQLHPLFRLLHFLQRLVPV